MNLMRHADAFRPEGRPISVTMPAATFADAGERRLRAQVWGTLLAMNVVVSIASLWLVRPAIL